MKSYFKNAFIVALLFFSGIVISQEKPIRIGLKIGFPNIIGGNVEYVTPLLNNRLAFAADYSSLNADSYLDPDEGEVSYFQVGVNYYLFKEGKGLYLSTNYGILDAELTLQDIESKTVYDKYGTANASLTNKTVNVKLGAKLGGLFYFRPEVGYGFTSLDPTVNVVVSFPDGTTENQYEEIPEELTKGLMFNIGFGFAF
jgi:hypothetical protein